MNKKDYKILARLLGTYRSSFKSGNLFRSFCNDLCDELKQDNPNFDKHQFIDAIGTA